MGLLDEMKLSEKLEVIALLKKYYEREFNKELDYNELLKNKKST